MEREGEREGENALCTDMEISPRHIVKQKKKAKCKMVSIEYCVLYKGEI